jgi:hypothetical protein
LKWERKRNVCILKNLPSCRTLIGTLSLFLSRLFSCGSTTRIIFRLSWEGRRRRRNREKEKKENLNNQEKKLKEVTALMSSFTLE